MFAASKTGGVVVTPGTGDPYWSSVSLLTNFENNLTFQDGSTNNLPLTRNGVVNPSLNTPFSGGVGGSEKFTGSSSYLTSPANAAFALGSGDFTVEAWCYFNSVTNTYTQPIMGTHYYSPGTSDRGWALGLSSTGYPLVYLFGSSGGIELFTSPTIATTNTWTHIAAARQGTTLRLFVNGVVVVSGSSTKNEDWTGSVFKVATDEATTLTPNIGNSLASVNGFLSNLRITKGTAVYTANFTPPTAPLTAITNTSLLITGTGQGMFNNATFVDQGPNALTVTATGAPVYSGLSPFGNTYPGSVYFGGDGNYLSEPPLAATNFSGSFTMETWINVSDAGRTIDALKAGTVISGALAGSTSGQWVIYFIISGGVVSTLGLEVSGVTILNVPSLTAALNTWHHVAMVRNGTTLTFYLNGTSVGSTTYGTTFSTNASGTVQIARHAYGSPNQNWTKGYFSNSRIVNGTAVYTANFTPSTTPLTAITNTSLLVRGDTGAFYDLSNNGLAETGVGSPVVTTQVKKFGSESGFFNGSSSYLTVTDSTALKFGSGDFTVEGWYYTGSATNQSLISLQTVSTAAAFRMDFEGATSKIYLLCSTNGTSFAVNISSTAISLNTWTYIAAVRSGTTFTLYINGVSAASTTVSGVLTTSTANYIGCTNTGSFTQFVTGYLDDIRITKGVARYTANFTPPTATFPTGP